MTKRQVRNAGHKAIFEDNKTHQETFDTLRDKSEISAEALAKILSQIPSRYHHDKTRSLWMAYIAIMSAILLVRVASALIAVEILFNGSNNFLILLLLLGVLMPIGGIYAASKGKTHLVTLIPLIIGIHFIRVSLKYASNFGIEHIAFLVLIASLGILAYKIYLGWKTPYTTRTVVVKKEDGREVKRLEFAFEEVEKSNDDLLDAPLL